MEKRLLFFTLFFALYIAIPAVFATHIEEVVVVDRICENLTIEESLRLVLVDNTRETYLVTLPKGARNVLIDGVPASITNSTINVRSDCVVCELNFQYVLDEGGLREISRGNFSFIRVLDFHEPKKMKFSLHLPVGYTLELEDEALIAPQPFEMNTDGKRIIVEWSFLEPKLPMAFFVKFANDGAVHLEEGFIDYDLDDFFLLGFILLSFGMAFVFFRRRRARYLPNELFSKDERALIDFLKKHRRELGMLKLDFLPARQKEITKALDWSKSKTSAVALSLERKQVIRRERIGRTYLVELMKETGEVMLI